MDTPESQSVGLVKTQFVTLYDQDHPLELECGSRLWPVTVAYETYGNLNHDKTNAILIMHALSGDAHVAGRHHESDRKAGWWDNYVGIGRPFDTAKYFVICSNILGGCSGTTGPSSINPKTGFPYGLDFPLVTIGDMVRVQKRLVEYLGIAKLMSVAGGSMGAMQGLQWTLDYPDLVHSAVIVAATPRLTAQNIAFNAVARQAIMSDTNFNQGQYYGGPLPETGLALARMMAHITYMSEKGLHEKFGRRLQDRQSFSYALSTDFAIESYLQYQGSSFVRRFDANTYLYITKAMDYFDPFPDPETTAKRLEKIHCRFLVASFDTDWRFDTKRSKELVKILNWNRKDVTFQEFSSPHGHDSFLLDIPAYKQTLTLFLERIHQDIAHGPRKVA